MGRIDARSSMCVRNSNAPRVKMVEEGYHWWISDSLHRRNLQGIPTEKQMRTLFHKVIPEPNSQYLVQNKGVVDNFWDKLDTYPTVISVISTDFFG
jgi:hypothetical protein